MKLLGGKTGVGLPGGTHVLWGDASLEKHGDDAPGATCTVHVRVRHEPLGVSRRRGGEARRCNDLNIGLI